MFNIFDNFLDNIYKTNEMNRRESNLRDNIQDELLIWFNTPDHFPTTNQNELNSFQDQQFSLDQKIYQKFLRINPAVFFIADTKNIHLDPHQEKFLAEVARILQLKEKFLQWDKRLTLIIGLKKLVSPLNIELTDYQIELFLEKIWTNLTLMSIGWASNLKKSVIKQQSSSSSQELEPEVELWMRFAADLNSYWIKLNSMKLSLIVSTPNEISAQFSESYSQSFKNLFNFNPSTNQLSWSYTSKYLATFEAKRKINGRKTLLFGRESDLCSSCDQNGRSEQIAQQLLAPVLAEIDQDGWLTIDSEIFSGEEFDCLRVHAPEITKIRFTGDHPFKVYRYDLSWQKEFSQNGSEFTFSEALCISCFVERINQN